LGRLGVEERIMPQKVLLRKPKATPSPLYKLSSQDYFLIRQRYLDRLLVYCISMTYFKINYQRKDRLVTPVSAEVTERVELYL